MAQDHREARAEAKAAKAHAKAMRPWYRKKRFLLPGGFLNEGGDARSLEELEGRPDAGAVVETTLPRPLQAEDPLAT